jgi:glycosyltransferase involved in cell wall biosynthesis
MNELGEFDVVMGRDVHSVAFAARRQRAPVIHEAHTPSHPFPRDVLHRSFYSAPTYGGIITQSEALASWYRENMPVRPDSVTWIPEGAEPTAGDAPPPNWPGRSGRLQAGYVGTLAQGKGTELIAEIASRVVDVDFHIVGGPSGGRPVDLSAETAPTNLHLHGFVEPGLVGSYLSALDCLLVTQQRQVTLGHGRDLGRWLFPMKVYDGMAFGLAMCVSDVPVLHEILDDGVTALFVPSDDVDAWAAAIRRLASDAVLCKLLGNNARKLLESNYTWRHRARRIVAFAESLVT